MLPSVPRGARQVNWRGLGSTSCRSLSSIAQVREGIVSQSSPAVEVVQRYLGRIEAAQGLGALITVDREGAIAQAEAIDKSIRAGQAPSGPLLGVPMVIKDNICVKGLKVGSLIGDVFALLPVFQQTSQNARSDPSTRDSQNSRQRQGPESWKTTRPPTMPQRRNAYERLARLCWPRPTWMSLGWAARVRTLPMDPLAIPGTIDWCPAVPLAAPRRQWRLVSRWRP